MHDETQQQLETNNLWLVAEGVLQVTIGIFLK